LEFNIIKFVILHHCSVR